MTFRCGIVGLPNVGKSTIFNALTAAGVAAENFPFCTIEPNIGVVPLPDERLEKIAALFKPQKVTPTAVNFVDIAGLVEGASKGEGLGNQFLAHIREVDAIVHVVRCFEDPNVIHVHGKVDPVRDVSVIETELMLADLDAMTKRIQKIEKQAKTGNKEAAELLPLYQKIEKELGEGKAPRTAPKNLFLLSSKPVLYAANVSETEILTPPPAVKELQAIAAKEGAEVVIISGKIEAEISELSGDEKLTFLKEVGLKESGLNQLARAGYKLLKLITFFTAGPTEVRAWTIPQGTKAPQAAGTIHSDFEKGFIRAECYHYHDLISLGSEVKVREAGKMRLEGKDYTIQDGDILFFRFNV
ncbi:MAG: redox-regulated ATPase YchF [Deltaproteobacteria bacterium]|nr:redox-regulated ATPase YchF [Deltaproteobacteria bacterium]